MFYRELFAAKLLASLHLTKSDLRLNLTFFKMYLICKAIDSDNISHKIIQYTITDLRGMINNRNKKRKQYASFLYRLDNRIADAIII
jgi:hypothetical protein